MASKSNNSKIQINDKFPVKVFARIRPLIKQEVEGKHSELQYDCDEHTAKQSPLEKHTITLNVNSQRCSKKVQYNGIDGILLPKDDNKATFCHCIEPSLPKIMNGKTVCCFAYGHTGSGKTHTMLGKYTNHNYNENDEYKISNVALVPGMFQLTCDYLFKQISKINQNIKDNKDKIFLNVQFVEIYKKKVYDLFSKTIDNNNEKSEAFIRQGSNDWFVIRGPTIKDNKSGKVKVTPLTSISAHNSDQVVKSVLKGLSYRKMGNSTLHDESSRSHALLSFELITENIDDCRMDIIEKESDIVPWGKERDNAQIEVDNAGISAMLYKLDETTGKWGPNHDFIPNDKQQELLDKLHRLEAKVQQLETIHKNACDELKRIIDNSDKCVTGRILFVDLAGNEYGSDIYNGNKLTQKEMMQMKDINKSLLALKECIRKMHDHGKHIPFRDSVITKVLKRHLVGNDSSGIMIANLGSSQQHIKKTINTLKYMQLIAKA